MLQWFEVHYRGAEGYLETSRISVMEVLAKKVQLGSKYASAWQRRWITDKISIMYWPNRICHTPQAFAFRNLELMTQSGLQEEHCDKERLFENLEVDSWNDTDFFETSDEQPKWCWHIRVKKIPYEILL